ncbi:polyprenol dehydrogenase-like isoform X2 [Littorina saxatilis]|uniref:Uncharacterized protein n=1 Tax=Littorina saxatilis TaxID=31220 RepID=A0AAN9G863_9CAEN
MAVEEQTILPQFVSSSVQVVRNIVLYVLYVIKLYVIGAIALICQLLEKSAPVRGLPSQSSRTAIVTGGACGIGFHISKQLASLGATVVIACRHKAEADDAIAKIKEDCHNANVVFMQLDLASFKSVRDFAAKFLSTKWPLHILINNAGIMLAPFGETEDGFERHVQVNHLSHALLTSLLKKKMESSAPEGGAARVVNVSSVVHHVASFDPKTFEEKQPHDWSYSPHNAYAASKLAILLYTYALSRRLAEDGSKVTVNAVHPGIVNTGLYHNVHWSISCLMDILKELFFMSPEQAGLSVVYVATSPDLEETSGCYFSNCQKVGSSTLSKLPSLQEDVYTKTCQMLGKKSN